MEFTPKELEGNVNVSKSHPLKEFFSLLIGLFGIVLVVYIVLGLAVNLVVHKIPADVENKLGELFSNKFPQSAYAKQMFEEGEKYLQVMVDELSELAGMSDRSFNVKVLGNSQANAFAVVGGRIILYSTLLEEMESENELAFVLAHELGHYKNRDHLRGLGRGLVLVAISAFTMGSNSDISNLILRSLEGVEMKFSQKQETEADLFALDLLNQYYGHVSGSTGFFERNLNRPEYIGKSYFFATHPNPEKRIERIRHAAEELGYIYLEEKPLEEM